MPNGGMSRQAQVPEQLALLSNEVELLSKSVTVLIDRLKSVLSIVEEKKEIEKTVEEELVPLANSLRGVRKKVAYQVERIELFGKRIEV